MKLITTFSDKVAESTERIIIIISPYQKFVSGVRSSTK